jgi:hypothetical protein
MTMTEHDWIQLRAYEIWLSRGCAHGQDVEDWLQAEKEVASVPLPAAIALTPTPTKSPLTWSRSTLEHDRFRLKRSLS